MIGRHIGLRAFQGCMTTSPSVLWVKRGQDPGPSSTGKPWPLKFCQTSFTYVIRQACPRPSVAVSMCSAASSRTCLPQAAAFRQSRTRDRLDQTSTRLPKVSIIKSDPKVCQKYTGSRAHFPVLAKRPTPYSSIELRLLARPSAGALQTTPRCPGGRRQKVQRARLKYSDATCAWRCRPRAAAVPGG
jgi:hypothetical protein